MALNGEMRRSRRGESFCCRSIELLISHEPCPLGLITIHRNQSFDQASTVRSLDCSPSIGVGVGGRRSGQLLVPLRVAERLALHHV